jgi:hypothetical protein
MRVPSIAMFRDRRAVSEIVASVSILLAVIVVGTFLLDYSIRAMDRQRMASDGRLTLEGERAQERFVITSVWHSGSTLNLSVLNFGVLDTQISDVYVNGERVSQYDSGRDEWIRTTTMGFVIFSSPVTITTGVSYDITVVSQRGATHYHSWEA